MDILYDGKCVGCGKINVENNLPSLSFHHRNSKVKEHVWKQLKRLEVKKIADILRKEDAVCLCSNCHRMIHFVYFKDKINEILTDSGLENLDIYKKENQEYYIKLFDNIKTFKFKIQKIIDPLKTIAQIGFAWERYLIHIYRITELKGRNEFTPKDIVYSLDLYAVHRTKDASFIKLIDLGYIKKISNTHRYLLTKSGLEKAKQLL